MAYLVDARGFVVFSPDRNIITFSSRRRAWAWISSINRGRKHKLEVCADYPTNEENVAMDQPQLPLRPLGD